MAALEERGLEGVTARKLERWRQRGLIPRAKRRGLGRHAGSVSVLPDGACDQVEAAAKAVARYRSIDQALLVMFVEGWRVDEQALKAAYVRQLEEVTIWMRLQKPEDGDALSGPEAGAAAVVKRMRRTKQGRAWRRRLTGGEESTDSVLLSAITALLHVFQTGNPSSTEALEEALRAGGVDRLWRDQLEDVGAIVPNRNSAVEEIVELLAGADVDGWVTAIKEATWDDLQSGLEAIRSMVDLFKTLSEMNETMLGNRDAFGFGIFDGFSLDDPRMLASYVPVMMILRRRMGDTWVEGRLDRILSAGQAVHEAKALIAAASSEQLDEARRLANELLSAQE